jgi:hypothetical protein
MLSFAQTVEHLSFKGYPIDGPLDELVTKLKKDGFAHLGTKNGSATLMGEFAGYKDSYVFIYILKPNDLVNKVVVNFPIHDIWATVSENFVDLKELLTQKYGKPNEIVEKFEGEFPPTDETDKIYRVRLNQSKFYCIWNTDKGKIKLSIEHDAASNCFVQLVYSDKVNGEAIKAKALNDL